MAEKGEEKLIEVARHIAKTLGRTDTMADDILQIFSNFDHRFSRENLAADRLSDGSITDEHYSSLDHQFARFLSSDRSIWSDSADAAAFLDAVDSLISAVRDLDPPALDHANDLLQQCMLRLEDEFRSLIENPYGVSPYEPVPPPGFDSDGEDSEEEEEEDQIPVAPPVTDYDFVIDALPPGSVADLHEIGKRMFAAGFGRECAHAYSLARRDFLEESICRLGIRHRATADTSISDEVQATPWTELEDEIRRWVKAVNVGFRILFPSERRLCLRIFAGLSAISDLSFAEACRTPAIQLLRFGDAIASHSRSPERLFRVADMYEAIRDVIPELNALFCDKYSAFLCTEAVALWKKLGATIRGIFTELDNLIRRDPATAAVPGGGLHPITRYVMNYLRAACASRQTLEEVMDEDGMGIAEIPDRPSSPLAIQIAWIMEVLQGNLEAKAKAYREPALSCVFLMNNGRYMMQKVRDSNELTILMGEEWIRRQAARERRWGSEYQKSTWNKVTAVLRVDSSGRAPEPSVMRERLKVFNVYFEETCRAQSGWVVADERLRAEMRMTAVGIVMPAYRRFLESYRGVEGGKHGDRNVKHSAQEVEARINELFISRP
ncbi:hypothetical protein KFK09_014914 [Dendrobium nobile]|uniref:Exocyst subunit Exo70 family protein n=1 Tax=Dendrobium nobile TaxID=94219 RepID=A0A8T3B323_DENNO|nr:hypothetical protein KFK09_014914 [Dendrobium nobile]